MTSNRNVIVSQVFQLEPLSGSVYASGAFTKGNGQPRAGLLRILSTGQPDSGFNADISSGYRLALSPDGTLYVSNFERRVNPDGSGDREEPRPQLGTDVTTVPPTVRAIAKTTDGSGDFILTVEAVRRFNGSGRRRLGSRLVIQMASLTSSSV